MRRLQLVKIGEKRLDHKHTFVIMDILSYIPYKSKKYSPNGKRECLRRIKNA